MRLLILFVLSPFFLLGQTQIGENINGAAAGDLFGSSVSISSNGRIVAIGAPENDKAGTDTGHVRVFANISGVWTQIGDDINGDATGDLFGTSVSISGDGKIVAIGGPGNEIVGNGVGYVRIFENISGVWTQLGDDININGVVPSDGFGYTVQLSNDGLKIAIGAHRRNFVRVYENISGTWTQVGNDIVQTTDYFYDIAFSGDGSTISISPLLFNQPDRWLRVYRFVAGNWIQMGEFHINAFKSASSLSYDGTVLAFAPYAGVAKIFKYISNTWTQLGNTFELSVRDIDLSSDGSIVAIQDHYILIGNIIIFQYNGNSWIQRGNIIGEPSQSEAPIKCINLSSDGSFIVHGTPGFPSNGLLAGYARVFGLSDILSTEDYTFSQFDLFPNPATNRFTIQLDKDSELERINIYNNLGQLVHSTTASVVDTSALSSGMYYVEAITNKGKATEKLILK